MLNVLRKMCINRELMIEEGYGKFSKKLYLILEKQDQELVAELKTHQFCMFTVTESNKRRINSVYLAGVLSWG